MNTYLISYDLRIPETAEDYKRIIKHIESYQYWAKPLKSVWFIKTSKDQSAIRDELKVLSDSNDGILVINVTNKGWATVGIDSKVTNWMKNNI